MRQHGWWRRRPIWRAPLIAFILASGACASRAPNPEIDLTLTTADRTAAIDAPTPEFGPLAPPAQSGEAERAYLSEVVVAPLLAFSLRQEATIAAERARAAALVAKVDAFTKARAPGPHAWPKWLWGR